MLVLGRLQNEKVILRHRATGDRIEVMVVRATHSVRLGFEAGQHWEIIREELLEDSPCKSQSSVSPT